MLALSENVRLAPHLLLDRRLGSGGQGEVWRARDEALGRDVAVKVMPAGPHWRHLARVTQEARLLEMLDHPHLVRLIASDLEAERPWLELELVEGPTLRAVLEEHAARDTRPTVGWVVALVDQMADALAYAHARGVVHRDLKPSNVLVPSVDPPEVKLIDLGVAKWLAQSANQATTVGTQFVGTLGYLAPEQVLSEAITERTDVHQLAVLAYVMLVGRTPWIAPDEVGQSVRGHLLAQRIVAGERPRVSDERPDVPAQLERVLLAAMAADPDERTPSMAQLRVELAAAMADSSPTAELALGALDPVAVDALALGDGPTPMPETTARLTLPGSSDDPTKLLRGAPLAGLEALRARRRAEAEVADERELGAGATRLDLDGSGARGDLAPSAARRDLGESGVGAALGAAGRAAARGGVEPIAARDPASLARAPVGDRRWGPWAQVAWPTALLVWGLVALVYVWRMAPARAVTVVAAPRASAAEAARLAVGEGAAVPEAPADGVATRGAAAPDDVAAAGDEASAAAEGAAPSVDVAPADARASSRRAEAALEPDPRPAADATRAEPSGRGLDDRSAVDEVAPRAPRRTLRARTGTAAAVGPTGTRRTPIARAREALARVADNDRKSHARALRALRTAAHELPADARGPALRCLEAVSESSGARELLGCLRLIEGRAP